MRQLHFWQTLQARVFIALILVGLVPLGLVGITIITFQSRQLTEQSGQDLTSLAQGLAGELDHHVEDLLRTSMAFADLPDIQSMDTTIQNPLLAKLHKHFSDYEQIAIANSDGLLIASAVPLPKGIVSIAHIESFRKAAYEGEQAWIIDTALSGIGRTLHMHTPIFGGNGRVKGVVGSPVSLESFAEVLGRVELESTGEAFVLDEEGRVLLHQDLGEIESQRDYSEWISTDNGTGKTRYGSATYNVEGEDLIAGYAPVSSFGWTLVVERPQAEVLAPARRSRTLAVGGLLATALVSLLAAILLARNLTDPIRHLAAAANALGEGDTNTPLLEHSSSDDEIGTMVRAFAAMRESVIDREAGLRRSEARMRAIIDAIPDALFRVHKSGDLLYVKASPRPLFLSSTIQPNNANIYKILGHLKPEKEVQKFLDCFAHAFDEDGMRLIDFCVFVDEQLIDYEARFVKGAGDEMLLIFRDITEQKATEAVLRQAQKMEGLGILAGGIAHDFNNLLTAILGQSSLAQTLIPPSNPAHKHIGHAVTSARSASELTRQLLAYAGKGQFAIEAFDLNDIIQKNIHLIKTALPGQAELVLNLTPEATYIKADRGQIQQVLMNLIINAAEALYASGGRVVVETSVCNRSVAEALQNNYVVDTVLEAEKYVCIKVVDNGRGISKGAMSRIFDPFYSTKEGGHGLGLSATLGIMNTFNGVLQVESEVNNGTTFSVMFPAVEASHTNEKSMFIAPSLNIANAGTILVIDDEPFVRQAVVDVLNAYFDSTQVLTASSGLEGIELFTEHQAEVGLVILDMKMPGMDGAETCRRLKLINSDVKIILVSGFSEEEMLTRVVGYGVIGFLEKPYELNVLVDKVSAALNIKI